MDSLPVWAVVLISGAVVAGIVGLIWIEMDTVSQSRRAVDAIEARGELVLWVTRDASGGLHFNSAVTLSETCRILATLAADLGESQLPAGRQPDGCALRVTEAD